MKDFCYPNTKSTNKIKQFFFDLGFVSSFFLLFFPLLLKLLPVFSPIFILLLLSLGFGFFFFIGTGLSSLMENPRPIFEALDEETHDLELECFEDFQACKTISFRAEEESCKMNQNQHLGILVLVSDAPEKRQENPDEEEQKVANHKTMDLRSSSMNGENHTKQNHIIKTQSLSHSNHQNPQAYQHQSEQHTISHTLSDLRSTRKEKEWRRTLACKLFQERHNSEGMDMLWEVYERTEEETRGKQRIVPNVKEEKSKINKSRIVDYLEELEEEEGEDANLCCLKALKFSAGKMHFGMAKPGILNFSKAFKGIKPPWLNHRHQRSRNKKV